MKRYERSLSVGCALAFFALEIFAPSYGWRVREFLTAGMMVPAGAAGTADGTATLAAENEALKAQLAEIKGGACTAPQGPANAIHAMVFSRYPFNFKNEILVDAGANEGVATGSAVTYRGIFIGRVAQVFSDSALVTTVFDNSFKMAVRVGNAGYDALLVGGAAPIASSILKTAEIAPGDIIYAAAPGAPYGLPLAVVATTSTSPDGLFVEAALGFAYDVNTVQSVSISR